MRQCLHFSKGSHTSEYIRSLKMVLEWGQCSDLLATEGPFVGSLNMPAPSIFTCRHSFTKWTWMLIIYAMGYQMCSHLAQHLPPLATAHTHVPIIQFHDNSLSDKLLWKSKIKYWIQYHENERHWAEEVNVEITPQPYLTVYVAFSLYVNIYDFSKAANLMLS